MKIESLFIYPIKSTKGIELGKVIINEIGLKSDRYFGIINSKKEIVTARENPKLLNLRTEIDNQTLKIIYKDEYKIVDLKSKFKSTEISIFKENTSAQIISNEINNWLTEILKSESRLVRIDSNNLRNTNDAKISFNDLYPIHLISTESFQYLNEKLETPIEINRFRPNIIVSGFKAFEETKWKEIIIGECEFKVVSMTERCSLITIDPLNGEKSKKQEPLRTLAQEFKSNGKVNFGIYLIPTKVGEIRRSDTLKIKTFN